jgi:hypothetical protein
MGNELFVPKIFQKSGPTFLAGKVWSKSLLESRRKKLQKNLIFC